MCVKHWQNYFLLTILIFNIYHILNVPNFKCKFNEFCQITYLCSCHHKENIQNSSKKLIYAPLQSFIHNPRPGNTWFDFYYYRIILPILEFYKNEKYTVCTFWIWILSINKTFWESVMLQHVLVIWSILLMVIFPLYKLPQFVIHSPVFGCAGFLHFGAI